MDNFINICVIASVTQILRFTAAVEKECISLNCNHISLHSNGDIKESNLYTQLVCSYIIDCWQGEPLLQPGNCATYSNQTKLVSVIECLHFRPKGYNYTSNGKILLPKNLSQLNDYMCGPLNTKGFVCSECADGFGPSVTSFGYRCVNCTDAWYEVPRFLLLELAPVTVFYLIVLIFQIRVTAAPIPCLILCAQLIIINFCSIAISLSEKELILTRQGDIRLDMKIVLSLYQVFNLDFGWYLTAPFCLSNRLKFIHIAFIRYISAFYPILLIFLTWACVELHGRNFKPLVWLWRPFHRCFVRLRRGWDTKSDIVDVFTTFFFLTYGKILHETILLASNRPIKNIQSSGKYFLTYASVLDQSIGYGSKHHLLFAIPALLIALVCNLFPPLLLTLYPIRSFRSFLLKCRLSFVVMHTFMDRVYGCYRNGSDGGRDMRSFSGFYFFLGIMTHFIVRAFSNVVSSYIFINRRFAVATHFFVITLVVSVVKPYRKAYMNYLDTLILSNYTLLNYVLSTDFRTPLIARTLIATPIAVAILVVISIKLHKVSMLCILKLKLSQFAQKSIIYFKIRKLCDAIGSTRSASASSPSSESAWPLIQPTSTVVCYGN